MVQGVVIEAGHLVDINPATGEEVGRVKVSAAEDVQAAIQAACTAQSAWGDLELAERGALLKAGITKLKEGRAELETTIVKEMGKVLQEAKDEVDGAIDKDQFIDLVVAANQPESLDEGKSLVIRQPHGVVAVCSPWNFPADEILLLAVPALIAGNCVIVKPSEVAPMTGALVVNAVKSALPAGVLDLVQGDGDVGAQLVNNEAVNMVAMTGSSVVGKKIMNACSSSLKRIVLELGGKDPMVVFGDSNIDKAAKDAVEFALTNCGQVCSSVERIYVEESVKAEFEQKVAHEASAWKVGNGFDEGSKVGPMVSKLQKDIVAKHVSEAVAAGAKMIFQSEVPKGDNFHPVTVLTDCTQTMTTMREETFGPVVAIAGFDGSENAAVKLANDTPYGLSACVYSKDMARATRVSRKIRAGQVGINNWPMMNCAAACPWTGHKGSGFGYHSGPDGWRQFSLPQSIVSMGQDEGE